MSVADFFWAVLDLLCDFRGEFPHNSSCSNGFMFFFFFLFHCRLFSASKSAHCQVSFHVIYNRLNSLTFMQSDTVRCWCCSSSVDKAPPPVLERHLTYIPPSQHLYMIIWYLHSFYTRWFESGAVFGVWLPQKVIDKWLWRNFIGCAVTTLVSRCLCCCPGSLHLDTALLVKWDGIQWTTWTDTSVWQSATLCLSTV